MNKNETQQKNKIPKKNGRPAIYTKELADTICNMLSEGMSLRKVCLEKGMPDKKTVLKWLREDENFVTQYARAKEEGADAMFEELNDISDETHQIIKSGAEKKSSAYAQAQRLRIDTRKWYLSKIKPKKYGEKLDLTSGDKEIKGNTIIFTSFKDAAKGK